MPYLILRTVRLVEVEVLHALGVVDNLLVVALRRRLVRRRLLVVLVLLVVAGRMVLLRRRQDPILPPPHLLAHLGQLGLAPDIFPVLVSVLLGLALAQLRYIHLNTNTDGVMEGMFPKSVAAKHIP